MNNFLLYPCVYGVLAVGKNKKIATLVNSNGKIEVKVEKNKLKFTNKFLLRGFFFLIYGIYYTLYGIFNYNLKSQDELENVKKASKSLNVSTRSVVFFIILVLSIITSIFLFGVLPIKLSYWLSPKNYDMLLKRLIVALSKILIISAVLLVLKLIPVFKNYYKFNSACEEKQKELKQINFLSYFISSVFLNTFVLTFVGMVANRWYFIFINIFVSLLVFIVNYEVFAEIQRVKWLNTLFSLVYNFTLQKTSHLEQKCVSIVMSELELSSSKRDKMQEEKLSNSTMPFSEAYVLAKEILEKANKFEKSDLDFIFAEVLNKSRAEIRLVKNISKSDYKTIESIVKRRANGEPISKIFQRANFYGLDFVVTKDVLSPRMDTERLVETVLKEIKPKQSVLDIGTGSGAIAIAIAKHSGAKVTAVDISLEALKVAKQNAKNNNVNVKFVKSDLFDGLGRFAKFEVIVSNPPYIPTKDIDSLDDEVKKHDPILALDGGITGLEFYKKIIDEAPKKLKANGKIFFEVGINQSSLVKKLLQKNFKDIRIVKDYNKIDRVVYATVK